jgi:hypothetical protein
MCMFFNLHEYTLQSGVLRKIIHKRSSWKKGKFYKHLLKLLRIKLLKMEILFIIGLLLLQIHNKRCTLHSCSSYVEILEN